MVLTSSQLINMLLCKIITAVSTTCAVSCTVLTIQLFRTMKEDKKVPKKKDGVGPKIRQLVKYNRYLVQ